MKINIWRQENIISIRIISDGNEYDISGRIITSNDGRCDFEEFETSWFADAESENFYDANWEEIKKAVINHIN